PVAGGFHRPGPARVWSRMRHPLVPDEEPSPLQRVLAVADSGNGLSGELDLSSWFFINPELTVHLHREAVGEWVCIEAATTSAAGPRSGAPAGPGTRCLAPRRAAAPVRRPGRRR